ncbi:hypothetical protein ACFQDF_29870 [Ectobacillus funiculus]
MQMQTQMTQPQIPNPPRAITTKDLLYIKDVLSWELLAFKKFHHLAQQVNNPDINKHWKKQGKCTKVTIKDYSPTCRLITMKH